MKEDPLVSMIVPTLNSGKTLKKCFDSIKNQTYDKIEIVVVDGGSSDNTIAIANDYSDKVYLSTKKSRTTNINFGVKMSEGEYIYRVNHDVILEPTIVEEAVEKCEDDGFDSVSIFSSPDPSISFWSKVRKLEKDCYKGDILFTGAGFFRRDVFEALGGYNEDIVFDDCYELNTRLRNAKYTIGLIEAQEIHLGEPKTIMDVFNNQYYYGKTMREFFKANPNKTTAVQLNPIRLPLLKNWKRFVKNPDLTIGFIVYDIIQYSAAFLGVISSLITKKRVEEQEDLFS